jgi:hypothetical protein
MKLRFALAGAALALSLPFAANASAPRTMNHFTLHLAKRFQHETMFMHVMASGTIRYQNGDAFVRLTTDGLPRPSQLGKSVYVLYASDMGMADKVAVLHISGMMAGARGEVMMSKVTDLYVYAQKSATPHPHGVLVLTAMV